MLAEDRDEVVSMLFSDVLDTKVVKTEREVDRTSCVRPKTRCECSLFVALLVESFFEQLLGYQAGVWETVQSLCDFYVYRAVGGEFFFEVVVGDNIFWEVAWFQAHVLAPGHGCVQIEIFDVDCYELSIGKGDDVVEEQFDGEEVDSGGYAVSKVVHLVTS